MSWEHLPAQRASVRLPAPDDGIVATLRPRGWLARAWLRTLDRLPPAHQPRLTRGRSLARSGRVRDLWFAPGIAHAEVVDNGAFVVSLRVRVLEDPEWRGVERVLLRDLRHIGSLLEGELPEDLVAAVAAEGPRLVPTHRELDGDCGCGDFLLPCPHMAAIHQLLAEALDEDPFLLLTLRGRTHEQLLARLRAAWGDDGDDGDASADRDEAPPGGDWFASPEQATDLRFAVRPAPAPAVGLAGLGPPPGGIDLRPALEPLYVAGGEAALRIALADERDAPAGEDRAGMDRQDWTEPLVDLLAELESAPCAELAARLGADPAAIGRELVELETLGIVFHTGEQAETRWWLG